MHLNLFTGHDGFGRSLQREKKQKTIKISWIRGVRKSLRRKNSELNSVVKKRLNIPLTIKVLHLKFKSTEATCAWQL